MTFVRDIRKTLGRVAVNRREFVIKSAAGGLGMLVGFKFAPGAALADEAPEKPPLRPDAFVRIDADNTVTIIAKHFEMGQGTTTGLATLAAEELDADWAQVEVEWAPADAKTYNNLFWGQMQGTGGSTAIANSFEQMRKAGAMMRDMLLRAAGAKLSVDVEGLRTEAGYVIHDLSGMRLSYGELTVDAAALKPPADVFLKDPKDFRLIGKRIPRKDSASKTDGSAIFAMDVRKPGMVRAVVRRPPRFGGKVKNFGASAARAVPGVVDVVAVPTGVAVLAKDTWSAIKGREALVVEWDETAAEKRGTPEIAAEYAELAKSPGARVAKRGDTASALSAASNRLEADYSFPYLAHAPMEPLNCVVDIRDDKCVITTGSQMPSMEQAVAAGILGMKPEQVDVVTVYVGGSFGRRATPNADYVSEAVTVAKAFGGKAPVHVVWTREDDIHGGFYRPMFHHRIEGGIDGDGNVTAWDHRVVGQSILMGTPFEEYLVKDGIDATSVEGVGDMPYRMPAFSAELHTTKAGVPVLWWRSVGHTHTAFAVESFLDELAHAGGRDPVELRLALMKDAPREAGVLKLVAEKAGWGGAVPKGSGRGIAVHKSFNSYVAIVADVSVRDGGAIKVDKITCAVDCGLAVNPDVVVAQMEGGIGYGLGAAMRNAITLDGGVVEQENFPDYEPLRLADMPKVEVHITPSALPPSGVGEPGVPPTAPAVANAIFAATGKRVRSLPMTSDGIEFA